MSLQNSQRERRRLGFLCVLLTVGILGCGGSQEESPTVSSGTPEPSSGTSERSVTESPSQENKVAEPMATLPPATSEEKAPGPLSSPPSSSASVLVSKELGMTVTGKGAGEPSRSVEVLEQQLLAFIPQIQEVYDHEREQDPNLMGTMDVSLTIEPTGHVSDLRFPLRRVSNERLVSAVFDRMRAWSFPPADEQVQLRYRLLFVPPGVDVASILTWEKQLGGQTVEDRSEERRVAAVAEPAKKTAPAPSRVTASRPKEPVVPPPVVSGWYRVTAPTSLRAAPRSSSEVVARLSRGTRVRVVGLVAGEWLEVQSVKNRRPGFLYQGDAELERDGRARSS